MSTHTHKGHCQVCLRIQAIDTTRGTVADHGYRVKLGSFQGSCSGSGKLSLHTSRVVTDEQIAALFIRARDSAKLAADLRAGIVKPEKAQTGERIKHVDSRGRIEWEVVRVPFAEATPQYQQWAINAEVFAADSAAKNALAHKLMLQQWATKIYDKQTPAYRVEDLEVNDHKVGDVVRIGGKKGFDARIEAIDERSYKTINGLILVPHARITRPAQTELRSRTGIITREAREARTYWEPLRHIKRAKSPLIEQLTKADLL